MRVLILALVASALLVPTAIGAEIITPLAGGTGVRTYDGTALISLRDPATGTYRLATVRGGEVTPVPGLEPQNAAFDADIGAAVGGRPQIIFSTTTDAGNRDLFVVSLPDGEVRPVNNANTSLNEVSPTLWRGRIAFVRELPRDTDPDVNGIQRDPIVYTKYLTAAGSRRVPGVPQRRCGDVDRRCGPTTSRSVFELELYGRRLAMSVFYGCPGCSGIAQNEVRFDELDTGRAEQVAFQVMGLSGQSLTGLSFADGRLAFYKSCGGDTSACQGGNSGPRALRLSDGRFFAAPGRKQISGFALEDKRALQVVACDEEGASGADCRLERTDPIAFAAARRPLRD